MFCMLFNLSKLHMCAIISGYVCWQNIHVFGRIGNIFPNTNFSTKHKNNDIVFKNLIMKFVEKKNHDRYLVWHKIVLKIIKCVNLVSNSSTVFFMIIILNVEQYGKYIKPNSIYINQINVCYWWQKGFESLETDDAITLTIN